MTNIIPSSATKINSQSTVVRNAAIHGYKRTYLPPREFEIANAQKRFWLLAAIEECSLRLSETRVLEALVFNMDGHGRGEPSICTLQEAVSRDGGGYLSYSAVRLALKRIETKGAIISHLRPNKTKVFELIGYTYRPDPKGKLESGSSVSAYELNSASTSKKKYYWQLYKNQRCKNAAIVKSAAALPVGSAAPEQTEAQREKTKEIAAETLAKIKEMLKTN
jgi:hypothetical protein